MQTNQHDQKVDAIVESMKETPIRVNKNGITIRRLEFQNGRSAMFEALKTRHPKFSGELPHPKYCGFEERLTSSGYVYQYTLMVLSKRRLLAGSQRPIKTYTLSVPRNRFPDLESAQAVRSRSRAGLLTIFWRHLGAA